MKKQLFSFVLVFALVIVTGTAMAQKNTTPYIGSTYTYTLKNVTVQGSSATASISYTDAAHATVPSSFAVTSGTHDYTFDVTYNTGAVNGTLTVTITEGTCSNYIQLAISPKAQPALALSIAGTKDEICQNHKTGTLTDNKDAVSDGTTTTNENTFDFVVTSTVTNVSSGTFGFAYDITFDDLIASFPTITINKPTEYSSGTVTHSSVSADASGTTVISDTYTVKFQTVAGISDKTLNAIITAASAKLTIVNAHHTKIYDGNITVGTDNVIVRSMPSIGTFTIE